MSIDNLVFLVIVFNLIIMVELLRTRNKVEEQEKIIKESKEIILTTLK